MPSADHLFLGCTAHLGDPGRVRGEQLGGEVAESCDHPRLDQVDLALEIGPTGIDLLRLRVPVPRRPALQDIRDEDVLPLQPDPLQQLREEAAGPADEREALAILLGAGGLAHEHQVRVRVAGSEDNPVAGLRERTPLADGGLVIGLDQLLAAGHRRRSRSTSAPPRGRAFLGRPLALEALLGPASVGASRVLEPAALIRGHLTLERRVGGREQALGLIGAALWTDDLRRLNADVRADQLLETVTA